MGRQHTLRGRWRAIFITAEIVGSRELWDRNKVAAILAEEYGPLIEAAREIVLVSSSSVARRHIDAANALRAELSKKGLI